MATFLLCVCGHRTDGAAGNAAEGWDSRKYLRISVLIAAVPGRMDLTICFVELGDISIATERYFCYTQLKDILKNLFSILIQSAISAGIHYVKVTE